MNRRDFLKSIIYSAGLPALTLYDQHSSAQTGFNGKFLITVQLDGGVDVTSFCDPKVNVSGEREINWWARSADPLSIGNLSYAPFAANQTFFEKHYQKMLVINGVDAQTNSHTVGIVNNWSGRNSDGFPSVTALYAANVAPALPLSYLNFGGYGVTSGIIRSTVIDEILDLRNLLFPNQYEDRKMRRSEEWDAIRALHVKNNQRLVNAAGITVGDRRNREIFSQAFDRTEALQSFGAVLPDENSIQKVRSVNDDESTLHQQAQAALLAFKSGAGVAADLFEGGYDTHRDHDKEHEPLLANSTDAIDYLWTYAEELGLADRLVVLIGSDFGRTPHYNGAAGKDHWPIGSYIVMEKNANFTNRVVGYTDEGHNTYPINPSSLQRDDFSGEIIKPAHVHQALRKYLGIHDSAISQNYEFQNTIDFDFFA